MKLLDYGKWTVRATIRDGVFIITERIRGWDVPSPNKFESAYYYYHGDYMDPRAIAAGWGLK